MLSRLYTTSKYANKTLIQSVHHKELLINRILLSTAVDSSSKSSSTPPLAPPSPPYYKVCNTGNTKSNLISDYVTSRYNNPNPSHNGILIKDYPYILQFFYHFVNYGYKLFNLNYMRVANISGHILYKKSSEAALNNDIHSVCKLPEDYRTYYLMNVIHLYLIKQRILLTTERTKFDKALIRFLFDNSIKDQKNKMTLLDVKRPGSESNRLDMFLQFIHIQLESAFTFSKQSIYVTIGSIVHQILYKPLEPSNENFDGARKLSQYIVNNSIYLASLSERDFLTGQFEWLPIPTTVDPEYLKEEAALTEQMRNVKPSFLYNSSFWKSSEDQTEQERLSMLKGLDIWSDFESVSDIKSKLKNEDVKVDKDVTAKPL